MIEPQKIWFVYLTDHHEGPFFPAEVATMFAAGTVNAQTLGWKDGMAEWIPIESIPELKEAFERPAPVDEAPGDFSLAEMLAKQQAAGGAATESEFSANADVLASFVGGVNEPSATNAWAPASAEGAVREAAPAGHEEVWSMKIGSQVSGLFSLRQLEAMAATGDIPPHAQFWHSGWTDFQDLSAVPELRDAAVNKRSGNTLGSGIASVPAGRKPIFAPLTAAANVGDEESTDTGIAALPAPGSGPGLKNLLKNITGKFASKKASAPPLGTSEKTRAALAAPANFKKGSGKVAAKGGGAGSLKRVVMLVLFFALLGAGGYGYLKFFASPISADLDVIADDLELLRETAKAPVAAGGRLFLAPARGTDENPVDDNAPKFYVASNLGAGTPISLSLVGKSGSLVNRLSFEKQFSATVGTDHLAVFERLEDEGKPLPMGEYAVKVSAEGATPLSFDRFMGGKKGAVYQDRLKKYKDKLQAEYDKEMNELREMVDTLKSYSGDTAKKMAEFKTGWANTANRARLVNEWKVFSPAAQAVLTQLDQKLKARAATGGATYQPNAFNDVGATLAQLQQLVAAHGQRVGGAAPAANTEELEAAVLSGVASLEQTLAQALVKSPFDLLGSKAAQGEGAAAPSEAPAAVPAPSSAPAQTPSAPATR